VINGKSGEMDVFVRIVTMGGFSAAARALKLTPSAVSKIVSRMEDRLGTQLIDRSTRNIRLTAEGDLYYRQCMRVLSDIEDIERMLGSRQHRPQGILRVNSSVPIARQRILPLLPEFLDRYPDIEIDLNLSDEVVDLMARQADVAIRIAPLQDSSLRARKIFDFRRVVVASPAYLARHGEIREPADLTRHNCLCFNLKSSLNEWPFVQDGQHISVPVSGNTRADNGESLRQLAVAGLGLARLATFIVDDEIRGGRLVPVLEDYHPNDTLAVYAVFFDQKYMPARIRCFVDFLVEKLGGGANDKRIKQQSGTVTTLRTGRAAARPAS
jgi:DNA-binding transcriptional LysR family regulator